MRIFPSFFRNSITDLLASAIVSGDASVASAKKRWNASIALNRPAEIAVGLADVEHQLGAGKRNVGSLKLLQRAGQVALVVQLRTWLSNSCACALACGSAVSGEACARTVRRTREVAHMVIAPRSTSVLAVWGAGRLARGRRNGLLRLLGLRQKVGIVRERIVPPVGAGVEGRVDSPAPSIGRTRAVSCRRRKIRRLAPSLPGSDAGCDRLANGRLASPAGAGGGGAGSGVAAAAVEVGAGKGVMVGADAGFG